MIDISQLDFEKSDGLVPAIVQDAKTGQVMMLGYMNKEAVARTIEEQRVTFYSRTKKRLWTKGETSGNYIDLVDLKIDCDNDTLLIQGNPNGPVCHTGNDTCFGEVRKEKFTLKTLERVIQKRKQEPKEGSYTNRLFDEGTPKISQKVGEEAVESIIEAMKGLQIFYITCWSCLLTLMSHCRRFWMCWKRDTARRIPLF